MAVGSPGLCGREGLACPLCRDLGERGGGWFGFLPHLASLLEDVARVVGRPVGTRMRKNSLIGFVPLLGLHWPPRLKALLRVFCLRAVLGPHPELLGLEAIEASRGFH